MFVDHHMLLDIFFKKEKKENIWNQIPATCFSILTFTLTKKGTWKSKWTFNLGSCLAVYAPEHVSYRGQKHIPWTCSVNRKSVIQSTLAWSNLNINSTGILTEHIFPHMHDLIVELKHYIYSVCMLQILSAGQKKLQVNRPRSLHLINI